MNKKNIIQKTKEFVKEKLSGDCSGHDWLHIERVHKNALEIAKSENVDLFVVELAAILHDVADHKFNDGDFDIGSKVARDFLQTFDIDCKTIDHICEIIKNVSYKGYRTKSRMKSFEGMIVQDADRLDAMGAIGIARTFAFGGAKNREIYNPAIKPVDYKTPEEYSKNCNPAINHFYEKLLLLKDRMNTKKAKEIAQKRHDLMLNFLDAFYEETGMNKF